MNREKNIKLIIIMNDDNYKLFKKIFNIIIIEIL